MARDEIDEYGEYLLKQGKSPNEVNEYKQYLRTHNTMESGGVPLSGQKPVNAGQMTMDYARRALDWPGSAARGLIGGLYEKASGKDIGIKGEDILTGDVAGSGELMKRAGVPKGKNLSDVLPSMVNFYEPAGRGGLLPEKGGKLDPSARGAVGFVADVATDPTNYLMGPFGTAAKAEGLVGKAARAGEIALNPVGKATEKVGEKLYRSGLRNLDTKLMEKGQEPVSPHLLEQGMWGRSASIQKGMNKRLGDLMNERASIYKELDDAGAQVVPSQASDKAMNYLADIEKQRYSSPKVDEGLIFLQRGERGGPMSLQEASDIKSSLYENLPDSAFDPHGKLTSHGSKLNKELASGYRQAILDSAENVRPGSGKAIDKINEEAGAYLSAQRPLRSEVGKEMRKNAQTQVDAVVASISPWAWLAKQGARAVNATPVRTGGGLLLNRVGQNTPAGLIRQSLANPMRPEGEYFVDPQLLQPILSDDEKEKKSKRTGDKGD